MNQDVVEVTEGNENKKYACGFCNRHEFDSLAWGPMYRLRGISVHYFCMLFSAGLNQNGDDEEGILGFLPEDIRKEFERGKKLRCKFCHKPTATIGCSVKKCKASFHYTCGIENGSSFQFLGNYEAYCRIHTVHTVIPLARELWECPICYEKVLVEENPLWPPCCQKAVFHRRCMMQSAKSAGAHFFKCPLCNDKDAFSEAMKKSGVYVPDRDAAWEMEPNAFQELTQPYTRCDKEPCLCPEGREFSSKDKNDTKWRIIRCAGCGATATHKKCSNLELLTYKCTTCSTILAGTCSGSDSEEETETRAIRDNRLRASRRRQSVRIHRRFDSTSSDDEEPVQNITDLLVEKPVIVEPQPSDYESDEKGSWKDFGLKNKYVVQYGKIGRNQYRVVGMATEEDQDDTEDEDVEDEDEFISNESAKTVSIERKPLTDIQRIRGFRKYINRKSIINPNCENVYSDARSQSSEIEKFKNKLDKLRNFYTQIPKADSLDTNDSQVRTGLVEVSNNYMSDRQGLDFLISSVESVEPGPSNRLLRSCAAYPPIRTPEKEPELTQPIEKIINIFKNQLAKSDSESKSPSKKKMESKAKPQQAVPLPVVEKLLSKFTEKAAVVLPSTKTKSELTTSKQSKSKTNIQTTNKPRARIPRLKPKVDVSKPVDNIEKEPKKKECKTKNSEHRNKSTVVVQHSEVLEKNTDKTYSTIAVPGNSKKAGYIIKTTVKSDTFEIVDDEIKVIGCKTPSKQNMRQTTIDSCFSRKSDSSGSGAELSSIILKIREENQKDNFTDKTCHPHIESSTKERTPSKSNEIKDQNSTILLSDDDDDLFNEAPQNINTEEPSNNTPVQIPTNSIQAEDYDDDIQVEEIVKLVKLEKTEGVVFDYNHCNNRPVASACLNEISDPKYTPTANTFFNRSTGTCISRALSSTISGSLGNRKMSKIQLRESKTGSGHDDEIVILDSSDEDGSNTTSSTIPTGSNGNCGERVSIPNRDENGNTSSKRERVTCSEDLNGSESKRPRITD